jgi:hypothetical protein
MPNFQNDYGMFPKQNISVDTPNAFEKGDAVASFEHSGTGLILSKEDQILTVQMMSEHRFSAGNTLIGPKAFAKINSVAAAA